MNRKFESEACSADLAVVGLGPGGLATALQAAKKGLQVVAFSDRETYIRGQRVLLDEDTIRFLNENRDPQDSLDNSFFQRLANEKSVQIKDLERFIYRKLEKYSTVTIVHINKTSIASVGRGEQSQANYIELQNGDRYYCKNIVAADGARRGFSSLISNNLELNIQYKPTKFQRRHKYNAVVQLQLKKTDVATAHQETVVKPKESNQEAYVRCGWSDGFSPAYNVFSNEKNDKFYFAGEIPQAIFNASGADRDEKLKEWAALFIEERCGISEDKLEYRHSVKSPKKDQLQAAAFEMNMTQSEEPIFELCNGVFGIIGDARRSPNFYVGHGLNDSISLGIAFVERIPNVGSSDLFDQARYKRAVRYLDNYLDKQMEPNSGEGLAKIKIDREIESEKLKYRYEIASDVDFKRMFEALNPPDIGGFLRRVPLNEEHLKFMAQNVKTAQQVMLLVTNANCDQIRIIVSNLGDDQIDRFIEKADLRTDNGHVKLFSAHATRGQVEYFMKKATPQQKSYFMTHAPAEKKEWVKEKLQAEEAMQQVDPTTLGCHQIKIRLSAMKESTKPEPEEQNNPKHTI